MMDLKDKYLDRIADALEEQMGVSPKLIGGNVLKPNIYRIADALDPEPTPLQDGTLKNPLARIAEVIESGGFGGGGAKTTIGQGAPDNNNGEELTLYVDINNGRQYIKCNGIYRHIGLNPDYAPIFPKIPDGITYPKKYCIMNTIGDSMLGGDIKLLDNISGVSIPAYQSNSIVNNIHDPSKDPERMYGKPWAKCLVLFDSPISDKVSMGGTTKTATAFTVIYNGESLFRIDSPCLIYINGNLNGAQNAIVNHRVFSDQLVQTVDCDTAFSEYEGYDLFPSSANMVTRFQVTNNEVYIRIMDPLIYDVLMQVVFSKLNVGV